MCAGNWSIYIKEQIGIKCSQIYKVAVNVAVKQSERQIRDVNISKTLMAENMNVLVGVKPTETKLINTFKLKCSASLLTSTTTGPKVGRPS